MTIYWENALSTADGENAPKAIQRLLTMGKPGLAAIARALGHPRDDVRESTFRALDYELSRWESGPHPEVMVKLTNLAEALAENMGQITPAYQSRVAKLAVRILRWPQTTPAYDGGRLLAACDRVLRACARSPAADAQPKRPFVDHTGRRKQQAFILRPPTPTVMPADPSMFLELTELTAPHLPRADKAADQVHGQPRAFFPADAAALVATNDRTTNGGNPRPQANHGAVASTNYSCDAKTDPPQDDPAQVARRQMRVLDPMLLFAQLNESPQVAAAAAAELDSRGFSSRQIETGKHLASPDAAERLRWAEALPGIRGIDARNWLLRLSRDVNLQVRRTAVGLLATDHDPEVMGRLRQIAVEETDPQLRDQAGRALEMWESP